MFYMIHDKINNKILALKKLCGN